MKSNEVSQENILDSLSDGGSNPPFALKAHRTVINLPISSDEI